MNGTGYRCSNTKRIPVYFYIHYKDGKDSIFAIRLQVLNFQYV
jgi:hypothetical protein